VVTEPLTTARPRPGGETRPAPVATALATLALLACSGSDESGRAAPLPPPPGEDIPPATSSLARPDWLLADDSGRSVTVRLVAGADAANERWNYNGHAFGDATVVVPEGATVTIELSNEDPATRHSVAVLEAGRFPITFEDPVPAFDGAMSSNATSLSDATGHGEEASISFTAGRAGSFALVCLVPAHAATGMWIGFEVSGAGDLGLRR